MGFCRPLLLGAWLVGCTGEEAPDPLPDTDTDLEVSGGDLDSDTDVPVVTDPPVDADALVIRVRDAMTERLRRTADALRWSEYAALAPYTPSAEWAEGAQDQARIAAAVAEAARDAADRVVAEEREGLPVDHPMEDWLTMAQQVVLAADAALGERLEARRELIDCQAGSVSQFCSEERARDRRVTEVAFNAAGELRENWIDVTLRRIEALEEATPPEPLDPLELPFDDAACNCIGNAELDEPLVAGQYVGEPIVLMPRFTAWCEEPCVSEIKGRWVLSFTPDAEGAVVQIPIDVPRAEHVFSEPGEVAAQYSGTMCCGGTRCNDAPVSRTVTFRVDNPPDPDEPPPMANVAGAVADIEALAPFGVDDLTPGEVRAAWRSHHSVSGQALLTQDVPLSDACHEVWSAAAFGTVGHYVGGFTDFVDPLLNVGDRQTVQIAGVDGVPYEITYELVSREGGGRSIRVTSPFTNRWNFRFLCSDEQGEFVQAEPTCPGTVNEEDENVAESDCRYRHSGPIKLLTCGVDTRRLADNGVDALVELDGLLEVVAAQLGLQIRTSVAGTVRPGSDGTSMLYLMLDFLRLEICPEELDARLEVLATALGATYSREGNLATIRGPDAGGDCPGFFLTLPRAAN